MKLKKRHIVLASLVLALSGAVFLNWQLSSKTSSKPDTNRELGVATYVNGEVDNKKEEIQVNNNLIKTESSLTDEQIEYFASARTDRDNTQDEIISLAQQVLELSESSEEAMEEAAEQLSKIEDNILCQSRVEVTLKGKGFSDCLCCLDETSCTVIVPENEIEDNSAFIISSCVSEVSGLPFENINVVGA